MTNSEEDDIFYLCKLDYFYRYNGFGNFEFKIQEDSVKKSKNENFIQNENNENKHNNIKNENSENNNKNDNLENSKTENPQNLQKIIKIENVELVTIIVKHNNISTFFQFIDTLIYYKKDKIQINLIFSVENILNIPFNEELMALNDLGKISYEIFSENENCPFYRELNKEILEDYVVKEKKQLFLVSAGNRYFEKVKDCLNGLVDDDLVRNI